MDTTRAHASDDEVLGAMFELRRALQDPIGDALAARTREQLVGGVGPDRTVGRYTLLTIVGRGAMGTVHTAYDSTLDRKVAVKIMLSQDSAAQVAMLAEARALARLSHPNVVTVHEAGYDGRAFVAMEFAPNGDLRQWMKQEEREPSEIFARMLEAGRGLAAAHRAGIVHHDFKPSNVLIGSDGHAKVADFGLAVVAQDLQTTESSGDRLRCDTAQGGTPAYMAPERIDGIAGDARSDQFSYCVALFEALVGQRPFMQPTLLARREAIESGEIALPPDARPIPRHVEVACRRGLSAEPEQRFPDMEGLLEALAPRHNRRRWPVFALVGIAAGATGLLMFGQPAESPPCLHGHSEIERSWNADVRAKLTAALGTNDVPYAAETIARTTAAIDDWTVEWVAGHREACAATQVHGEQSTHLLDLRMACLERHRAALDATVGVLSSDDSAMIERAAAAVYSLPTAMRCAARQALLDADRRRTTELSRLPAGWRADPSTEDAIRRSEAEAGAGRYQHAIDILQPYADASGLSPSEQARVYVKIGLAQAHAGTPGTQELLERAFDLALRANESESAFYAAVWLAGMHGVSFGRNTEGKLWLGHAAALLETFDGGFLGLLNLHEIRGIMLSQNENAFEAGIAEFNEAIALIEENSPEHPRLAEHLRNLAETQRRLGRYEQARANIVRARSIIEGAYGVRHPRAAKLLDNHATILMSMGDLDEAETLQRRSLALHRELLGPEHQYSVRNLVGLADIAKHQHDDDKTEALLREAFELETKARGEDSPYAHRMSGDIALIQARRGEVDEAVARVKRGIEVHEAQLGPDNAATVAMVGFLARVYVAAERWEEALAPAERALKASSDDPAAAAEYGFSLAQALWFSGGDRERARTLAREAEAAIRGLGHDEEADEVEAWLQAHGPTTP